MRGVREYHVSGLLGAGVRGGRGEVALTGVATRIRDAGSLSELVVVRVLVLSTSMAGRV